MIIGELQDAQTTGAQERSSRRLLEEQIQGISRVVEGLEFDAGVDAGDHNAGESSSNGGSSSNHTSLPRRLRLIRARVQAMESNRQTSFNEIGDLERELDDMRETFTERELEWWEQKKRTRNYEFWLQTLQLEYGMTLWRHRGLELELLSTHRDIETLYARIESFPNGDLAQRLFEAEQTNSRIYEYLEAQQTHIVKLEVESSGLRGRLKEMEYALQQQHSRVPAYLKKIEEVVENREGAYRRLRELEGQSLKPSRSMTPEACSEYKGQTVQNLSPRKNVRFESPPQLSASSSSGSWATSEAESSPTTSYATPLLHRLTTPSEYPCIQTLPHPKPNSTSELSS
ncbi:hypothetical protein FRB95_006823 [Tulasnella sp. JGI-2019a]|nr:hypothetical protein FRB93_007875 [Tulasnella sp. JGI-2019a]KAG9028139.1 hypothetical protein FRB95_006823 [Tulasnella sp. JGI-2019a]